MNEIKFLEAIKSNNGLSDYELRMLIEKGRKELLPKKINIFNKIFNKLQKSKTYIDIINDNFDVILDSFDYTNRYRGIMHLLNVPEVHTKINDNIVNIMKKLKSSDLSRFLRYYIEGVKDSNNILQKNLKEILEIDLKNIFYNSQLIKEELDDKYLIKLSEILEEHKLDVCKEMINELLFKESNKVQISSEDIEDYSKTLSLIIDELLENENANYSDINKYDFGYFSDVYFIGEKVLKIGTPRVTYEIPNHRRILQPLLRTNFYTKKDNNNFACVEVTQKVEPYLGSEEKLYEIYKELRDAGITLTDFKRENFGVLKKDNVIHWKNGLEVEPSSAGLIGQNNSEPLKAGDIVIIDSDFLYRDDDPNIAYVREPEEERARERYEKELKSDLKSELKFGVVDVSEIKDNSKESNSQNNIDKIRYI